jgi:O-antigen biosynthesis protein
MQDRRSSDPNDLYAPMRSQHDAALMEPGPSGVLVAVPLYRSPDLLPPLVDALVAMNSELGELNASVVFINDSPDDPDLATELLAARDRLAAAAVSFEIWENSRNLGFIATANRALEAGLKTGRDVILLNSDALPRPGAFAEMAAVAYLDPLISVCSPRSDNATICNSPVADHLRGPAPGDAYRAHKTIEEYLPRLTYVPTAVGFCLFVKSTMIARFGLFDPIYGFGYNEENDFILRCNQQGYRAVLANRAYVHHLGEASFSQTASVRAERDRINHAILIKRYPEYDRAIGRHFASPEYRAEHVLGGLAAAGGRLSILFDCRAGLSSIHAILRGLCEGLSELFDLRVLCSSDEFRDFHLDEFGLEHWTEDCAQQDPSAVAFRMHGLDAEALASLPTFGAVIGALVLDVLALDCHPADDDDLQRVWSAAAREFNVLGFASEQVQQQFTGRVAIADGLVQFVVREGEPRGAEEFASAVDDALRRFSFAACCGRQVMASAFDDARSSRATIDILRASVSFAELELTQLVEHARDLRTQLVELRRREEQAIAAKRAAQASELQARMRSADASRRAIAALTDARLARGYCGDKPHTNPNARKELPKLEAVAVVTKHENARGGCRAVASDARNDDQTAPKGKNLKVRFFGRVREKRRSIELEHLRAQVLTERNLAEGIVDPEWYLASYPDVRENNFDPVWHFIRHGAREGRNPGPNFNTNFYVAANAEVRQSGVNPLLHYIQEGRDQGLAPNSSASPLPKYAVVKPFDPADRREFAIMVAHAPIGRLKPHVLPYVEHLARNGIAVLLVVVADRPADFGPAELAAAAGLIVRENIGYDFAAWAHGLRLFPEVLSAEVLYILNDSVVPVSDVETFDAMITRIRHSSGDVVGLTASHEYGWHVQSYFLAVKRRALASWAFQLFVREIKLLNDKDEVIQAYEVPFAGRMQASGLVVETLFDSSFAVNPTLFGWRELIRDGFPFVKLLLLRGRFPEADIHDWESVLQCSGFDLGLVHAAITASEQSAPPGKTGGLLARPQKTDFPPGRPLKIAYFGPWNYDNGLGQASRELLNALRRTGHWLNVEPITKPFHIHRPVSPAVALTDFSGDADIAIVHLNPDSWHLLNSGQRESIRSARYRIGYWVWETDTIPSAWQADLRSVDRIWAPSSYCAEIFATAINTPVDVVPHAVAAPDLIAADRSEVLSRFGVDPDSRVILYVFDGASYLIRKNPSALVRAFRESGLQTRGWRLLLKTKHLFDRPDAGRELSQVVEATTGATVIDATLDAEDLTALLRAADIYASPHCSEGFGLTVAEAMALGKPVVATDFSGTRDFLDSSCGYPVKANPVILEEDHGHYLAGHGWAQIDERALAESLIRAASVVEAGDDSIGSRARSTIAAKLSYETVARAIEISLREVVAANVADLHPSPAAPPPPSLPEVDLSKGEPFRAAQPSDGIVPVCLEPDLSWRAALPNIDRDDDWYFFAPADAMLAPDAFTVVREAITARPDVVLFYADDVTCGGHPLDRVRLKPEFDPTLIAAQDYIGVPVAARASLVRELGGLQSSRGSAALYDLVLRMAERGTIGRIPHVLIGQNRERAFVSLEERRTAIKGIRRYAHYEVEDRPEGGLGLSRRFSDADCRPVTIIIPTRRSPVPNRRQTYIERALASLAHTDWPLHRLTVLVGDDVEAPAHWEMMDWPFTLRRIATPREPDERFNYAAKMNRIWRAADDEQLVLMNDDCAPENPGWLKALQTFALDQSVGGVGARLLYENGALQHAGIFPSLHAVVHAWAGMGADARTYQNWATTQREWSMVTGAVFATRRTVLERVGGFDERFSLEFNDIDLCLRLRALGYRIVYTPDAQFVHAEKASRGSAHPPAEEVALFLSRWSAWLKQDPSSHPGYAQNRVDVVPAMSDELWFAP